MTLRNGLGYEASLAWQDPDGRALHRVRGFASKARWALTWAARAATTQPASKWVTSFGSLTMWWMAGEFIIPGAASHLVHALGGGAAEPLLLALRPGLLVSSYETAKSQDGGLLHLPPLRWTESIPTVTHDIVEVTIEVVGVR